MPTLVREDGSLDRLALGREVFRSEVQRAKLNSIVHPAVRWAMLCEVAAAYLGLQRVIVLDVPLLFETGLDRFCGLTVSVICDEQLQLSRLRSRDAQLSEDEILSRIHSQIPAARKGALSDRTIVNDGSLEVLNSKVDLLVAEKTPGLLRTLLQWFWPVGAAMAAAEYFRRSREYKLRPL